MPTNQTGKKQGKGTVKSGDGFVSVAWESGRDLSVHNPETVAAWPLIFPLGMNPVVHEHAGLRQAAWYFAKVAIAHWGCLVRT